MTFLHPALLAVGALCVALPILVHFLMRRRRKPVRWAAMRFIQEAYRQQRRRLRLEQLLLLAARCVLIALIAVGVARPMVGAGGADAGGGPQEMYLLVDTGIGSALVGDAAGGSDLEHSVERALAALHELDTARGDRAALISLGGPARGVVLPATADLALVERRLRGLVATDSGTDLEGGMALLPEAERDREGTQGGRVVAVYSGFREGSIGGAGVGASAGLVGAELVASPPADMAVGNVGLVSVEALRPVVVTGVGGTDDGGIGARGVGVSQVRVRSVRSGVGVDAAGRSVVRMTAAGESGLREVGVGTVVWSAGQETGEVLVDVDLSAVRSNGPGGRVVLRAELEPDANERDNVAWAVIEVRERLRVAVVGTRRFGARPRVSSFVGSDWLGLALGPASDGGHREIEVEVLDAARLGPGGLAGFDAAVVAEPGRVRAEGWAAVGDFAERGGTVLVAASATVGAQLWTEEATRALGMEWSIGREPVDVEASAGGLRPRAASGEEGADVLWFIRGELEELARSVSVSRVLEVDVADAGEVVLETKSGRPVLVVSRSERGAGAGVGRRGVVALLATAVDLGWSDLPARPLMVPLVQELVRYGVGAGSSLRSIVAGARVRAPAGPVELSRRGVGGEEPDILGIDAGSGQTRDALREAGAFVAVDAEGVSVGAVVVQPDAAGARAGLTTREQVAALLVGRGDAAGDGMIAWSDGEVGLEGGVGGRVRSDVPGPGLLVLLAAAGLALVELWLARVASHAAVPMAGGGV